VFVRAINNRVGMLENISSRPKIVLELLKADMSGSTKSGGVVNTV
jgi:hypothetical protein